MSLLFKLLIVFFATDAIQHGRIAYKSHKKHQQQKRSGEQITSEAKTAYIYGMAECITSGVISILAIITIIVNNLWMFMILGASIIIFSALVMVIVLRRNNKNMVGGKQDG